MQRYRRLTRWWTARLFCLFLLTLPLVSSGRQPTAADVPALVRDLEDKDARVRLAAAAGRLYTLAERAKGAGPTQGS